MDVTTAEEITLVSTQVHTVALNAHGLLGHALSALLLGRSSITLQGIFALPAVIDTDFLGQIKAMIWTPSPPVHIPKNTRIAQLVPFKSQTPRSEPVRRGSGGFGSTGQEAKIMWALEIQQTKPKLRVMLCWGDQMF